jgi:hypothetical protein
MYLDILLVFMSLLKSHLVESGQKLMDANRSAIALTPVLELARCRIDMLHALADRRRAGVSASLGPSRDAEGRNSAPQFN